MGGGIVKGTLLGLALFAAWLVAIALIFLAAYTFEYWFWAIFPAAFITFGIAIVRDREAGR